MTCIYICELRSPSIPGVEGAPFSVLTSNRFDPVSRNLVHISTSNSAGTFKCPLAFAEIAELMQKEPKKQICFLNQFEKGSSSRFEPGGPKISFVTSRKFS